MFFFPLLSITDWSFCHINPLLSITDWSFCHINPLFSITDWSFCHINPLLSLIGLSTIWPNVLFCCLCFYSWFSSLFSRVLYTVICYSPKRPYPSVAKYFITNHLIYHIQPTERKLAEFQTPVVQSKGSTQATYESSFVWPSFLLLLKNIVCSGYLRDPFSLRRKKPALYILHFFVCRFASRFASRFLVV